VTHTALKSEHVRTNKLNSNTPQVTLRHTSVNHGFKHVLSVVYVLMTAAVLTEKLIVAQIVNNFTSFCGT
jgi:hypothetical protein